MLERKTPTIVTIVVQIGPIVELNHPLTNPGSTISINPSEKGRNLRKIQPHRFGIAKGIWQEGPSYSSPYLSNAMWDSATHACGLTETLKSSVYVL
jgi:hypothetical protein